MGLALAGSVAAQAQQPTSAQTDAIRQSCRSDFMANCAGVQPGGKDALLCLKDHLGSLSAACKIRRQRCDVARRKAKPGASRRAGGAQTAGGGTSGKQAAIGRVPAARGATAAACGRAAEAASIHYAAAAAGHRDDLRERCRRHCQGVPPGGERILECLAAHAAQLTPACYAAIKRVSEK